MITGCVWIGSYESAATQYLEILNAEDALFNPERVKRFGVPHRAKVVMLHHTDVYSGAGNPFCRASLSSTYNTEDGRRRSSYKSTRERCKTDKHGVC